MSVIREDVVKMGFDVDWAELTKLTGALDDTKKTLTGGIGGDAFDEMVKESKKAAKGVEDVKEGVDGIKPDGLEKTVKGLKDTDKKGEEAHKQLKKIADTKFNKTVSGLKSLTKTLGKVGIEAGKMLAKGIAVGVAGVGALVAKSVMSYADYEQLVGGVDTMFKDSSGTVQKYASEAWQNAGMSENDYMTNVMSFSASLIKSLGGNTGAAAEYANMAMVDMSDNVNKFGSDLSSIQDAYQGFAKQNYTMLDNLKLGYGGTQEEMKRLLKDASAISGVKYDISSYADIIAAIHTIQENMGVAGTTAKEANSTISGSFASMKAAWGNTLTSLVLGGDDFDRCIENLVASAKTFGKNIMPVIVKALGGVGSLIEALVPIIEKELPVIVKTLLPPLIKAAAALIKGLIIALPDIIKILVGALPGVLQQVWEGISSAFGDVPGIEKVGAFFASLKNIITENTALIQKLIPVALGLIFALKLFNKIKSITSLFGGGKGGSGGGFFSGLASMNPKTALKGILNLTIIIGGLALLAAALMWAAPYMAQLSDMKSILEVMLVIGLVGLLGTGMSKLAASVGNIPVATVLKGVGNIAIALVGFGALAAVLMWLAPYMAQLSDMQTTFKILLIIGAVGLIGSALAALAGLVGMIPIAVVLQGIGNVALALGAFTAIVAAFGALSQIDGFNEFLSSGGEVLANLCGIVGEMAGSLIGGLGEGVTNSLPKIGENLSAFATALKPMFSTFAGVDATGLSTFASALSSFIAVIAGEKIVGIITGGINYAELGTNLSTMATSLSGFFSTIMTFPEGCFEKASALFSCLANISGMPKEGGVVGWFQGEVNFATIAAGLNQLAGAAGFFTAIQAIPEEAFTKAKQLFDCLAGIKALPKDGGVVGWFQGEVNFANIASGIQSLASEGMISALTTISALPETAFTGLLSLFDALAGIKAMPKEGGIAGWFTGDSTTGLTNVASQLPGVATNIASFFTNLGGRTDFTPIKTLFDTLSSIEIDSDAADKGFLSLGKSKLEEMGTGLSNFAKNASTFFTQINTLNAGNVTSFFAALSTAGSLPDTLSTLDASVGTALSNLVTTANTKLTELKGKFSDRLGEIIQLTSATGTVLYSTGVAMMTGLNNGMLSMKGTLIATAKSMAAAIQTAFDVELDINSPSKVMEDKGIDTVMGHVVGMRKSIPEVQDTAKDVAYASIPYRSRYTPEGDSNTINHNRTSSEVTSIAPVFNLTVTGSQDDRVLARKVQRFVNQAFQSTLDSLERKTTPVTREA